MILKVQLPLEWSVDTAPKALVYDSEYTVCMMVPVTDHMRRLLGNRPKSYWHGTINPDTGELTLTRKARWQSW